MTILLALALSVTSALCYRFAYIAECRLRRETFDAWMAAEDVAQSYERQAINAYAWAEHRHNAALEAKAELLEREMDLARCSAKLVELQRRVDRNKRNAGAEGERHHQRVIAKAAQLKREIAGRAAA